MVQSKRDWVRKAVGKILEKFGQPLYSTTHDKAVDEYTEYYGKDVPPIEVSDLKPDEVVDIFGISTDYPYDWSLAVEDLHPVPDLVQSVLDKFDSLIRNWRSKLDLILTLSFADEMEATMSNGSYENFKLMWFEHESDIRRDDPVAVDSQLRKLSGKADYALWYGDKTDQLCRLVIVKVKASDKVIAGGHQCMAYIAMVLESQEKARISSGPVYGIVSDGVVFHFFRMRRGEAGKCLVTNHMLAWNVNDRENQEIITHLRRIFRLTYEQR